MWCYTFLDDYFAQLQSRYQADIMAFRIVVQIIVYSILLPCLISHFDFHNRLKIVNCVRHISDSRERMQSNRS